MRKTAFILFSTLISLIVWSSGISAAELLPGQGVGKVVVQEDGAGEINLGTLGKPYVLAFFVPGGEKDKSQLQEFQKILKNKELSGVEFFTITRGLDTEEQDKARVFIKSTGIKSRLLFEGKDLPAARKFGARYFPSFYIVDKNGALQMTARDVKEKPRRLSFEEALVKIVLNKDIPYVDLVPVSPNSEKARAVAGKPAKDFSLVDLNGKVRSISGLKGKKNIILVFWSPECPHCLHELPQIQQYYMSRRFDFDFEVLAVSVIQDEDRKKKLEDVVARNMFTFPVIIDKTGDLASAYGVGGVPCVYFIDKNGVVQEVMVGGVKSLTETYNSIFNDPQRLGTVAKKS